MRINVRKTLLGLLIFIIICLVLIYFYLNSNYNYSKKELLDKIDLKYKPRTEIWATKKGTYKFPFILKPNYCSKSSISVALIKSNNDLKKYFKIHSKENTIVQDYIPYDNEVGVYFEKNPFEKEYKILSITKNSNLGGKNIQREKCTGNYELMNHLITPNTNRVVNDVLKNLKNDVNIGRFDLRYRTEHDFLNGRFKICELNLRGYDGRSFSYRTSCTLFNFITSKYYGGRNVVKNVFYGFLNMFKLKFISLNEIKNWPKNDRLSLELLC